MSGAGRRWVAAAALASWALLPAGVIVGLVAQEGGLAGAAGDTPVRLGRTFRLAGNSLLVSGGAALMGLLVGGLAALALSREGSRGRWLLLLLVMVPLLVPPTVTAVAGVRLLGGNGLLTNLAYTMLGWEGDLRVAPVFSLGGLAAVLAWSFFPLGALAVVAGLLGTPSGSEEAALLETGRGGVLARVTLPLVAPFLLLGSALVFLPSLLEFGAAEALRSQPVLVADVYTQFGVYYDTRAAAGSAVAVAVLGVAAVALVGWFLGWCRFAEEEVETGGHRVGLPWGLRLLGWVAGLLPAGVLVGVLVATLAGPDGIQGTLAKVASSARGDIVYTTGAGTVATALAVASGGLLGLALSQLRRPMPWRLVLVGCFLLPGPVMGIGLKRMLLWPPGSLPLGLDDALAWFDGTSGPLVLAWVHRFAPLVALLVEMRLRAVPAVYGEIQRLEAEGLLAAWRSWMGPAILPALGLGALVVFALVVGESGAAVLLVPPGPTTLSVRLLTLMHYAPTAEVSALCLLIALPPLLVAPLVAAVTGRLMGRGR